MIRMIFSTVLAPQEPALTVESFAISATGRPPTMAVPVITPSAGSPCSAALAKTPSSVKLPSSIRSAIRSRANSLPAAAADWWYLGAPPRLILARASAGETGSFCCAFTVASVPSPARSAARYSNLAVSTAVSLASSGIVAAAATASASSSPPARGRPVASAGRRPRLVIDPQHISRHRQPEPGAGNGDGKQRNGGLGQQHLIQVTQRQAGQPEQRERTFAHDQAARDGYEIG